MKFLLAVLVCAGWSTFWSRNYAFHSMPRELTHPDTEAQPAWLSGSLSPEATAILESKSKGPERTLSRITGASVKNQAVASMKSPATTLLAMKIKNAPMNRTGAQPKAWSWQRNPAIGPTINAT
jgi:hypothetical protein